ncbi:hypothetical protein DSL72_007066 [Monilinia vaccinii-corymbosi]|uniref:Zn(2)-C6 fungal-type domain-containing protein n=1 Tax=Monilinia vaccinii-corymbosi TaxID=61207 RepID=A0A8A3PLY0_9HELO|nr:hypothetical protein DSL72_007066 [Monilinia vaccinii-corymbosi]
MQSYPSPNATAADSGGGPFYGPSSSNQNQHQHQQSLPTPDELQLAEQLSADAQLSRSMQPNMGASRGMSENPDPRGQANVNLNHPYQPEHQMHGGHPQMSQGHMDMGPQYEDDSISPLGRKRSKVSRACDECRRKKIKCNSNEAGNEEMCSNCKRVGVACQFSRQPMKRGPSKGYIKELADRINSLEGQVQGSGGGGGGGSGIPQHYQHPQEDLQRRPSCSEDFSPTPNPEQITRKRDYSSISGAGEFVSPYQQQRSASNWIPQEPQARSSISNSSYPTSVPTREQNYSPSMMVSQQKWLNAPDLANAVDAATHTSHPLGEDAVDWIDDSLLESYYKFIHPTYPMLSLTKPRLNARLSACPGPVRFAFWEALHAAIRSFPAAIPLKPQGITHAVRLMHTAPYDSQPPRSPSTNIIYLQIMMLLAIEANNQPRELKAGEIDSSPSVWIGTAVGFAYSLRLHLYKPIDKSNNDPDSDDKLARRVWWSLVMMERWNATTTTCPLQIPDSAAQVYPDDQGLLGEVAYHLVRLAIVVGNYSEVKLSSSDLPPYAVHRGLHARLLKTQLELWRQDLSKSGITPIDSPVTHIAYWSAYLLVLLHTPQEDLDEQIRATHYITSQLSFNTEMRSPLIHYFKSFAALALPNLLQFEGTTKDAETTLKTFLEGRLAASPWDNSIREFLIANLETQGRLSIGQGQSQVQLVTQQAASSGTNAKADDNQHMITAANQGLQRLADLATASTEDRGEAQVPSTDSGARNDKDVTLSGSGLSKM